MKYINMQTCKEFTFLVFPCGPSTKIKCSKNIVVRNEKNIVIVIIILIN